MHAQPEQTKHKLSNHRSSQPLDVERIGALCTSESLAQIEVFQELDSTNSFLLQQPIEQAMAKVCCAESQTAGRGRHGNQWMSTPNRNIMMSLSWGFSGWPIGLGALSLAVGLGVSSVLIEHYQLDARIKWPNDILVDDAKLAGILIDTSGHAESDCGVVIGLGLNVDQADWGDELPYPWIDLHRLGIQPDRNVLLAQMIDSLVMVLKSFARHGFAPMRGAWNSLSAYHGRQIELTSTIQNKADAESQVLVGQMAGVDEVGALQIIDGAGRQHLITSSNYHLRLVSQKGDR